MDLKECVKKHVDAMTPEQKLELRSAVSGNGAGDLTLPTGGASAIIDKLFAQLETALQGKLPFGGFFLGLLKNFLDQNADVILAAIIAAL